MRFPGFEGAWEAINIGKVSLSLDYGMSAAAKHFDGVNKYIRITDIDDTSANYRSNKPVSPNGKLENRYLVGDNDILFARTGASTGKTYLYDPADGKLYFAGFLIRARIKEDYNAKFVFCQTQTSKYRRWVKVMSMRSGQPGINSQEYSNFKFLIPPSKGEQDRIAVLIAKLDIRIQTQNKIIGELQTLIRDFRNQFFKQKIRLKDEFGNDFPEWKKCQLSDVAERIVQKNSDNDQNVLTISAQFGLVSQLDFFNKPVSAKDVSGYYLLRHNDFAYNKSYSNGYPMGAIKRLKKYDKGIVSTLYICFRFNGAVNVDFIEQYFESGIQNLEIEKIAQEGARNHGLLNVGVSDFLNIEINLPSVKEQNRLAHFLIKIDQKIQTEKAILEQLEKQKKYLLQQMFV